MAELRHQLDELKPLKIEHKLAEESLLESERKLSTLIGNLPGVVYRCLNDNNWTMEFISDGCVELTGFEPSDLIGNRTVAFNELIHPNDQPLVWDQIQSELWRKKDPTVSCIVFGTLRGGREMGLGPGGWGAFQRWTFEGAGRILD